MIRFTLIKPKALNTQAMQTVMEASAKAMGDELVTEFNKKTARWKEPVPFRSKVHSTKTKITVTVEPEQPRSKKAKIFQYQDEGTRRHFIKPKKAKALRFPVAHKRGSARSKKGVYGFSKGHWVSGIKAKNWTTEIMNRWKRTKLPKFTQTTSSLIAMASGNKYE